MWTARTVVVLALVLCSAVAGGLVAADPLDPLTDTHHDRGPAVEPQTNGTMNGSDVGRNDSLGGEISSFMQITAASAEGAVDSGMWRASINDSTSGTEQDAAIAARIDYLWKQFDSIQTEKADLRRDRNNNTSVSYVARASRLAARIDAFRTAVNQTAELAAERNVSGTEMARLEAAAAGLGTVDIPAVNEELVTGPSTPSSSSPSPTAGTPASTPTPASTETPIATPTQTATAEPTTTETDTSTPTETPTPETTPTQTPPPTDPPTSTTTPPTTEDQTDEAGGSDGDGGDDGDGSDDSEGDDDSESEGDGDTGADGDGSDDNENESSTSVDDAPGSTTIPPTGTTDTSTTSATSAPSEQGLATTADIDTIGTAGTTETSVA